MPRLYFVRKVVRKVVFCKLLGWQPIPIFFLILSSILIFQYFRIDDGPSSSGNRDSHESVLEGPTYIHLKLRQDLGVVEPWYRRGFANVLTGEAEETDDEDVDEANVFTRNSYQNSPRRLR